METFWIILAIAWSVAWGAVSANIVYKKGYESSTVALYFFFGLCITFIAAIVAYFKEDIAARDREIYERAKREKEREKLMKEAMASSTWRCPCGALNKDYETSCHRCGKTFNTVKQEMKTAEQTQIAATAQIPAPAPSVGQSNVSPVMSAGDIQNDLKKYKEMLDDGLITEEEFTAKKKQLLGL